MDIDTYDHMGAERNGTGSNSDGYITPVEHITRIQVQNFTPFPARDALASALTQPSEQSQFTSYGSLSDDLDVALARKRSRRLSSASLATARSQGPDGQASDESRAGSVLPTESRVRKRTVSRASARELPTNAGSGNHPPLSGTGIITGATRPRTQSISSSISGKGVVPTATVWQTYTQKTLKKVLESRLVETFISITVPSSLDESRPGPTAKHPTPPSPPMSHARQPSSSTSSASKRRLHSPQLSSSRSASGTREELLTKRASRMSTATSTDNPASASPNRRVAASPGKPNGNASKSSHFVSQVDSETQTVPNYISAIHRPSTNPDFALDLNDFSKLTDPLATHITVQLWAKLHPDTITVAGSNKGKEKEIDIAATQWKIAGNWDICLSDLVPLPDENSTQTSTVPSNTPLLTLSPPGKTFYLPVAPSLGPTRPPSPSSGYNSDPEVHTSGNLLASKSATPRRKDFSLPQTKTRQSRAEYAATSSWQDLVKLVNIQCAIIDTRQSLSKVIQNVDALFGPSDVNRLIRDISEREARLADWRTIGVQVRVESEGSLERIRHRKEALKRRRDMLSLARSMLGQDVATEVITEKDLSSERESVAALHRRISPIRVTLITTLASLFPIDLISASDLLFSILGVPLPIPLGATDPAPPLSLPAYKDVNEESVATALAYAAFVVQLLAAYLDRLLVYPITFCGSRSMIRDGISAMVGPRMFPLFSRGVDTYRFEYGVFLLNKNIELLMSDRDLRALDMRHTLPNLKNLLLTLSDGEGARSRSLRSPAISLTGLESPVRPSTPVEGSPSTGSASTMTTDPSEARTESPPHSGSTTPSKTSVDTHHGSLSRMSRPFFGLSGFLRPRYPSGTRHPSVKVVPEEAPEASSENESEVTEEQTTESTEEHSSDDEDHRTLRGVAVNGSMEENTKDGAGVLQAGSREKEAGTSIKIPVTTGEEGDTLAVSHILTPI